MQFSYTHQNLQYAPLSLQNPMQNMLQTPQNQYFQMPTYCNYGTPLNAFAYDQFNLFNKQQLQMNVQTDLLAIPQIQSTQQQYNFQQLYQNNLLGFQNQYDYKPILDNQQQMLSICSDFQPIQYMNTQNNLMDLSLHKENTQLQTSTSFSQPEVMDNYTQNLQVNEYQEQSNILSKQIKTLLQEDIMSQQKQAIQASQKQKTVKKQVERKNQKQRNTSKVVKNNNIINQQNQINVGQQLAQLNQSNLNINHTQTLLKIEQGELQLKTEFESTLFKQSEELIQDLKMTIKFENQDENLNDSKSFSTTNNQETKQNCQSSLIKLNDQKLINQKLALEKARQQEEQFKLQLIEDLDPSQREILRLAIQTNRQNINRNFIKQYKQYVNTKVKYILNYEKSDQQKYQFRSCKNQPVQLIADPTPQEKISFQKKFNKFIASKIYSNNDIKQIIENKIYGFLFQEFLNNEVTDWIEQNISDRKSDYLCIVKFYLLCCQQNQYLCFMNDNYSLNRKNIQYFTNF
ncbi:hypothetical protein ABPG74_008959 [Tetrahymena malaccensis]